MKKYSYGILIILGCILLAGFPKTAGSEDGTVFRFTLLHTNDLHSAVVGADHNSYFTPAAGDHDPVMGHYARLSYLIDAIRRNNEINGEDTLLVDSGDFYSGTIFHILAPRPDTPALPELEFFQYNGYDAATFGNHEFDAGAGGFITMLGKNIGGGTGAPLVSSNAAFPASMAYPGYRESVAQIKPYLLRKITANGATLTVGIIAATGGSAAKVSLQERAGLAFTGFNDGTSKEDQAALRDCLQRKIDLVRGTGHADIVILLLHGGAPEDEYCAKNLTGLNVVIAGHTHEAYNPVKVVNNVFIAQAGSDGRFLGNLDFEYAQGALTLRNADDPLITVDDSVPADERYCGLIDGYLAFIDDFLAGKGYAFDTPVFESEVEMKRAAGSRNPYGVFVTSELRHALNRNLDEPVDVYCTGLALVRKDITLVNGTTTRFQFSDLFQILPIGFSENTDPGAPIVTFYFSKGDLKKLIEVMDLYRQVDQLYTPAYSDSLSFGVRAWGIPFVNRIKDLTLNGVPYCAWPSYVKIATTQKVAQSFAQLKDLTYGIISFTFRDKKGIPADPVVVSGAKEYLLFADAMKGRVIR